MKNLSHFLFASLLLISNSVFSQDLIVKNNNDSINCKVIKQSSQTVFYFTYVNKEEITNAIAKSEIKTLIIDFYNKDKSITDTALNKNQTKAKTNTITGGTEINKE